MPTTSGHFTRDAITEFLFIRDEPGPVDLALVLGSPSVSSILPAIDLYRAARTPLILISGAGETPHGKPEWQLYKEHALSNGIPEERLLLEREARNTRENIELSAKVIEDIVGWANLSRLAICAKPFHMRRVYMTARSIFPPNISVLLLPPDDPGDIWASNWWKTERGRKVVLEELGRISTYALKGDLGDY